MEIFNKIKNNYQQKLPFVVYRKFNEEVISGFFQQTDALIFSKDLSESGFVFAPFNKQLKSILIPENKSEFVQENIALNIENIKEKELSVDFNSKNNYIKLVEKGVKAICQKQFDKVVLSRKEEVNLTNFNLIETYKKLLQNYPNAFVYVWFHPKVGLWLGATPEILVKMKGNDFETMALAGTQSYKNSENINWNKKEIEEQQIVTDYIVDNLKSFSENLEIGKVQTVKAGSLLHLKTKITGKLTISNLKLLTSKLHPTPAVCGMPLQVSEKFIVENENYNRGFYTGFLGELNLENQKLNAKNYGKRSSELYVNLRCMELQKKKALIYIGGGITKDSILEKEWEETVAKAKVMKRVL